MTNNYKRLALQADIDRANKCIAKAKAALAELDATNDIPAEPDDDQVVWIDLQFNQPTIYHYSAIKSNGKWYVSGRNTTRWDNGVSWENLMKWVTMWTYEIWAATNYEEVI